MANLSRLRSIFDDVVATFTDVTRVARYLTIAESAGGFTIPDPNADLPLSDRHIQDIDAPGVVDDIASVIVYRTTHTGSPTFTVRLNSTRLTQQALTDAGPHTWHEIVPAGALKAENNELTFAVSTATEGSVTFSDVVILYTANQLTVRIRREPVATQG